MTSSSGAELEERYEATNGSTETLPAAEATEGPAAARPPAPPPADPSPTPTPTPPPAAAGPRLLRREVWVDVPEYPGFRVKLWINYPQHWDLEMTGADFRPAPDHEGVTLQELRAWNDEREAAMRTAYGRVVLEHNGWLGFEGEVLPQPQDPLFWELIPTELAATVVALQKQASAELPNSIQPRRRR
jgi:hypothetical protein